ncbi:hypothetical protein QYE76_010162 [Lolium multiflorum]|uniref:Uncharacterized protein n=1 Tax=Lolium multiflorum TaxID=4521 RepID=A0AAD8TWR5_LOLMU|nr:hypothetical protein QYE76_010162 [Lolium multiflorum]
MSITLGEATKLLDNMMINYSEWHTERAPQGKKVNSVEESSSLNDKVDAIMSMLVNDRTNIDPNNVPLASLVAQEEHVDVNFIKNNNFNNNAYRNNSSNNYRPYPYNNGNGYGNSYGNSYNNNRNSPPGLEAMLKEFISTQTAFNKSVEEKLGKIDILVSRVDSLASDVDLLKSKVLPNENYHNKITTTANAIQVIINENIRLMAELRARWDREENEKLAKEKNIAKVWTITTTSNANATHVAAPPTHTNKRIGVSNVSTSNAKREKLPETAKTAETACDKAAEIFSNIGDDDPIALDYNGLNFDDCHISEVIKFLQKLAKSPNASAINLAFTHHITNALIKAREEKLEREASIPKKLEDGWEPIIKMKVKDFDCNALCDLGASISVMPKKIYNMLDLPPLKNCYLDVNLADHSTKKPLGKVDNVRITVNNNLVPVDFVVLDIECNASCPIILGRPFLRTVGAIIDMREDIPLENAYEESRRQNILQNKIIAAKLGILWNGTKSPHPKSLPRFFTRVMCRQKDDSVGQLLKKLATAHVPNKDSERASDADIGRKEAGFGPIVLASNHLRGRLGSAHLDPPELNIKEKQVTAHVPAKQHCSTDVQSSSDANVCRNKTEGCGNGEAKIRRLQKDLDVATWRNKEMNRGWNSTIQDGLHAVADLQKLVAGNLVTALADADVHEINWTILEQVKARAETLHSSLQVDDFQRVMQEPLYE